MSPLDSLFDRLSEPDVVVYDDQFKGPGHVFRPGQSAARTVFSPHAWSRRSFAGFFRLGRGVFIRQPRSGMLGGLVGGGASDALRPGVPTNRSSITWSSSPESGSDNGFWNAPDGAAETCVTSPQFVERDLVLYDGDIRLPYLHYIGIPAEAFNALCADENVQFRYRDLFLAYRYLHEPERRPRLDRSAAIPTTVRPAWPARTRWRLGIAARSLA